MGWKIIEIEQGNNLKLFLDNLVIFKDENKILIPIKNIDLLLINNYKTNISIQTINQLSNNNVTIVICDNQYLPTSQIVPIIGNYNTLKIFEKQINWNHKWKAQIWEKIIAQKIKHQAELIRDKFNNIEAYTQIINLIDQIKSYDISNREGHAAKIYWHNFFGINFSRDDDDFYYNKLLNYGYTILRAYFTRSIIKKGLDPRISFFHKSFHNYFALASDLMEIFRIIIDQKIYDFFRLGEINFYEHKQELIELFNDQIKLDGKSYYINNAIDIFVDRIVNQGEFPIIELINNG